MRFINKTRHILGCTVVALALSSAAFAELAIPENPLWQVIEDEVYLQEIPEAIAHDKPITAVAIFDDDVYVGDSTGVLRLVDNQLIAVDGPDGPVATLTRVGDSLWAATATGLWRLDASGWSKTIDGAFVDVSGHRDGVIAAGLDAIWTVVGDEVTKIADGRVLGVASYSGGIYVHDASRVGMVMRDRVVYEGYEADWGSFAQGCAVRDIMAYGSRLLVATDEGLYTLRGMTWYETKGEDGLCYEDTTALAIGFDRDIWIGTMRGAIRNVGEEYHYFGYPRWIPHDKVNAIASGDNVAYFATEGGLGIIHYEPFTLAKKADYYEKWLDAWGQKRLGFVHSLFLIDGEWVREVSDNDVGYSSHYMAAKCFEFAVTGDPKARAAALDMMKSVKWSEEITPIEGFPARSIYNVGERTLKADHGSGGLPAEWHATDDGQWEWKGDTSSDETDAHVYETSLFLELVANDREKVWATEHLHRVFGHIVDNGFFLRDVDGKPTRWARWDPEYLQTPYGYYARGLNGLEAFNYMTTAYHFTQDEKFAEGKEELLAQNYLRDILKQKLAFHPGEWTHFDDRLAFYSYFSLVRYETDPELKALWLRSLERSWEIKRIEGVPWFNFIYGALTGNDCETDRAVAHLREWPLDLRRITYTNSHRDDLHTPEGYHTYAERKKPLSPRATEANRWDGDFMRLDRALGGRVVADPGGWLDAYWMGRYFGMITEPKTKDPAAKSYRKKVEVQGAKPYAGPPRPKLWHEQ